MCVGSADVTARADKRRQLRFHPAIQLDQNNANLDDAISPLRNQTRCLKIDYSKRHLIAPSAQNPIGTIAYATAVAYSQVSALTEQKRHGGNQFHYYRPPSLQTKQQPAAEPTSD